MLQNRARGSELLQGETERPMSAEVFQPFGCKTEQLRTALFQKTGELLPSHFLN